MRNYKCFLVVLLSSMVLFTGCKYDDDDLWDEVKNQGERIDALEAWSKTVNDNISSLQALLDAQERGDYITGITPVVENGIEVGYTITFTASPDIIIRHGESGEKGSDGSTPDISVKQDTDGKYYWTLNGKWLLDGPNKMPVTGDKGENGKDGDKGEDGEDAVAPQIRINTTTNFWETSTDGGVNWTSTGIKATGEKGDTGTTGVKGDQGDAIFAKDGINTTNPDYVIFTLADKTTKITLPRASAVTVAFDSYETFTVSLLNNTVTLVLPETLKETDYTAIVATVMNSEGTGTDIQTRSAATSTLWGVEITKPTFTNGAVNAESAGIKLIPPTNATDGDKAILEATIISSNGLKYSVSRPIEFFDGVIVATQAGSLSSDLAGVSATDIKKLYAKGSLNASDFAYIKTLTNLHTLDLSETDLTTIENSAFAMCANLQEIHIPASVRTLGKWMFEGCMLLETVELPNGITEIPASAFYGCGITSMNIPASVISIGEWAFEECSNLVSINIPTNVTVLQAGVFLECNALTNINWHNNITTIENDALAFCRSLPKSITLPTAVTTIGMRAFAYTGITSVILPEGLISIGGSAFNECNIADIELPSTIQSVNATAFYWPEARTVTCHGLAPFDMPLIDDGNGFSMFNNINSECMLYVPEGTKETYQPWGSYFKNVLHIGESLP